MTVTVLMSLSSSLLFPIGFGSDFATHFQTCVCFRWWLLVRICRGGGGQGMGPSGEGRTSLLAPDSHHTGVERTRWGGGGGWEMSLVLETIRWRDLCQRV